MHFLLKTILPISLCFALTGCGTTIIAGGLAGGYAIFREKNIGDTITDAKIDTEIKSKLYKIDKIIYNNISVVTNNGCVLLTGTVDSPEFVTTVEQTAWSTKGVQNVDNNITVGDKISMSQMMIDNKITAVCKTVLLFSCDIKSINYKIKTIDGVVYITGISMSKKELELAIEKIQRINDVQKIISYVEIKTE